ncbi:MAG: acetyl-CoA carboxylase biotin carboxyl carrier protein [Alphaproteobacteria bacterium]|jgi:acetyl-CoA carboxylase biotin carboxyl carrier protein|nr:acetyl-CoA carboxylase biotin carboxyl carrier protein [Alphaproteobacteria bacterium]
MTQEASFKGDLVRQLAEILNDTHLTEIEYEVDGCRVRVARQVSMAVSVPTAAPGMAMPAMASPAAPTPEVAPAPAPAADPASNPNVLKAPMVGTAYMASAPGDPAFVKEGDVVKEGQTLLIIEAMKVMNQIKSPRAGVVKQIFVKDTDPIEYGQPLILVEA